MNGLSIIIPAQNSAGVILETLLSTERAIGCLRDGTNPHRAITCEVVIVDDGSVDDTPRVVRGFLKGKDCYRLVQRATASNAGCARNVGAAAARGDLLCFLDADDRFLERHLVACCEAMEDSAVDFVKTGVSLDAPVHSQWYDRIVNSLVTNLAIRRSCHEFVGGFPDFHIFRRYGDLFLAEFDAFRSVEDVYYNRAICEFFSGLWIPEQTVRYSRSPGNAFDRQYEKFRVAPGTYAESETEERKFQIKVCNLLFQHHMARLRTSRQSQEAGARGRGTS
jgi:glycosyltransferase involved in cell wall biosynthesis